jgi:hypothetical protein
MKIDLVMINNQITTTHKILFFMLFVIFLFNLSNLFVLNVQDSNKLTKNDVEKIIKQLLLEYFPDNVPKGPRGHPGPTGNKKGEPGYKKIDWM